MALSDQERSVWVNAAATVGFWVLYRLSFGLIGPAPFNELCEHHALTGYPGCFTWAQVWGSILLFVACVGYAWCGAYTGIAGCAAARNSQRHGASHIPFCLLPVVALGALAVAESIAALVTLVKPWAVYQTDAEGNRFAFPADWTIDVWNVWVGCVVVATFLPLGLVLLAMAAHVQVAPTPHKDDDDASGPESAAFLKQDGGAARARRGILNAARARSTALMGSVVIIVCFFMMSATVTPIWNFSQQSYMMEASRFGWVWWPVGGIRPATDKDGSGLVDFAKCLADSTQCPWFNFKFYSDSTVFYGAMLCVILAAAFLHSKGSPLRRHMNFTLAGQFTPGITGHQALFLAGVGGLAVFWFVYWFFIYARFHDKDVLHDTWPATGPRDNLTIHKTYSTDSRNNGPNAMWWIDKWGQGPMAPFTSLLDSQHMRPVFGDGQVPSCSYWKTTESCEESSYCFWSASKGDCELAVCKTINKTGTMEQCLASSWCHWAGGDASAATVGLIAPTTTASPEDKELKGCVAKYEGLDDQLKTGHGWLHITARASGHMASCFMSLTFLLSVKKSPFLVAVGKSWEEVLPFHRTLGYVAFFAVTFHMLAWWLKWVLEGTFQANLFPATNFWLWVTPTWNHFENWSIPFVQYSWFLFAAAVAIIPFRRKYYRAFYFLHHAMPWMVLMGLVHAWAFVNFILVGLLLWWWDRLVRLYQAAEECSVMRADALKIGVPGVTHLELRAPLFASRFRAGQYGFLRLPEIDSWVYHPFTANVRGDRVTFLIKDMQPPQGGRNWTHDLFWLADKESKKEGAQASEGVASGASLIGPFGGVSERFFQAAKSGPMVLVAGGIGVTPVIGTFAEVLARRSRRPGPTGDSDDESDSESGTEEETDAVNSRGGSVLFIWVNQGVAQAELPVVQAVLARAREAPNVEVRLYFTRAREADVDSWTKAAGYPDNVYTFHGRPNWNQIFDEVDQAGREKGTGVAFACGPPEIQDLVVKTAQERNYAETHSEVFLF